MMIERMRAKLLGVVAVAGLLLVPGGQAIAQGDKITAQTLIDREAIYNLLTRYYYNFGKAEAESFSDFYTDDAELAFGAGGRSYKGHAAIDALYKGNRQTQPGAAAPVAPKRFSFNVLLGNPLILVHGNKATAQMIFTEVVIEKEGDQPKIIANGREYDDLVKVKGQWRFAKRHIMPGTQVPEGWSGG